MDEVPGYRAEVGSGASLSKGVAAVFQIVICRGGGRYCPVEGAGEQGKEDCNLSHMGR